MIRPLIIGGSGQLGSAIRDILGQDVVAPTHSQFDILKGDLATLFELSQVDVVINCAAFHNVDMCEREPELAFANNAIAIDRLAANCASRDIPFVTISTDYVFDGASRRPYLETDAVSPRTIYGASKAAGEWLARRHGAKHIIVRTSGLYGLEGSSNKGKTLIAKVLLQAQRGEVTRMVDDVIFSPSFAPDVARVVVELIGASRFGTYHVANAGSCSWFEFVERSFQALGMSSALLQPIKYASLGSAIQRPMYSAIESAMLPLLGIEPMRTWESALDEYLREWRRLAG